jgi:hypothetical protein
MRYRIGSIYEYKSIRFSHFYFKIISVEETDIYRVKILYCKSDWHIFKKGEDHIICLRDDDTTIEKISRRDLVDRIMVDNI